MKNILVKKYSDDSVLKIIMLDQYYMDKFIIDSFDNEDDMENYFSGTKRIELPNGKEDSGIFKLFRIEKGDYIEQDIIYRENYTRLQEEIYFDLINDKEYIKYLMEKCPRLFPGTLLQRFVSIIDKDSMKKIYDRNIKTLKNNMENGGLKDNIRDVYNATKEYKDSKNNNKIYKKVIEEQ